MKIRKLVALAAAFVAMSATQISSANGDLELIFSGSVDSVDAHSNALSVLNHQVIARGSSLVEVGAFVNVYGRLQPNGTISGAIVEKVSDYATGANTIYLKGSVTSVSAQIGRLSVGGAVVDYTALLSDSSFQLPQSGETIVIVGTQPSSRGVVLASNLFSRARQAGVIQTGNAAGVIQTGNSLGVIQTGSAAGVIQTGDKLGVIQTGSAAGVIQTGDTMGVIQTGNGFSAAR